MKYCITHNDLDGIGCAIILEKVFGDIQTFVIGYDELDEVLDKVINICGPDDSIFITDLSLNEIQAKKCHKSGKVQHIDHHSSSMKLMKKYSWSATDVNSCGTKLVHNMIQVYAHMEDYQELVNLIDNYDTWGHGTEPSPESHDLNRLFHMIGPEAFTMRFLRSAKVEFSPAERAIVETDRFKEEQYKKKVESKGHIVKTENGNFGLVAAEQYQSSVGHYILNLHPEIEYVMMVDLLEDKVSLRGRGNIDLGEMAKELDGGGHAKAAGFPLKDLLLRIFTTVGYEEKK